MRKYAYIRMYCTCILYMVSYHLMCINIIVTKYGYCNFNKINWATVLPFKLPCKDWPGIMDNTESFMGTVQKLFDECDNQSNKILTMMTNIYVNHQTELQDYVTNIALIFFF